MSKENKEKKNNSFETIYAIIVFILIAAILSVMTVLTFKSKYIAYDEQKLASNYVDSIVQNGDGYDAYKYTLVAKNSKYGDFVRKYYIYPVVYPGYEPGMDTDDFDGYDDEQYQSDTTANDDGTLAGQVADAMYPYYIELMNEYGWDNYDAVFSNYFERFVTERQQIFGDEYLSDEVMFAALESNVSTYGDEITGTSAVEDADSGVVTGVDSTGLYQTIYGDDYKITTTASEPTEVEDLATYVATMDANILETYGITADDIADAVSITVSCALEDGQVVFEQTVYEIKIGHTWYVDNLTTDTSEFYNMIEADAAQA